MDENEALEYFWPALVSRELWKMRKDMLCALHANSFYAHSKVFAVHERRDAKEVNREKEREIYACGGRLKLRVREEDGKKKKKKKVCIKSSYTYTHTTASIRARKSNTTTHSSIHLYHYYVFLSAQVLLNFFFRDFNLFNLFVHVVV